MLLRVIEYLFPSRSNGGEDAPTEGADLATSFVCTSTVCANCGIAEGDEIKLLDECTACQSVRYCGDKCRQEHHELHSEECKKRKDEIHDRKLFALPEKTCFGECPICFLPLPIEPDKSVFYACCSQLICQGCDYANAKSSGGDGCPFCREPAPDDDDEHKKRVMKRIKAKDPAAMRHMGMKCYFDERDYDAAFGYLTKAAELGDLDAHHQLGYMYGRGQVPQVPRIFHWSSLLFRLIARRFSDSNKEKARYHYEKAAIGGHPFAMHNLACIEEDNGNMERAVKHLIIAAKLGHEKSMKALWRHYSLENITKEDLEGTLRTHHAAISEMKSEQREEAYALFLLRQNRR